MFADAFWLPLLVKIGITAAFVTAASVTAERAGPFFGALIVSLPVAAGPTYVLLALQASDAFIAESAVNSLAANAGAACFLVTLVLLAPRRSLALSLACALAVWLAAASAMRLVAWTAPTALLLNAAAYSAGLYICRRVELGYRPAAGGQRWYELPLRAAAISILVAGVVTASNRIGPAVTGLAAVFPLALSSLALVVHLRLGGQAVAVAMASAMRALPGLALALAALHYVTLSQGAALGLVAALAICLGWSAGLIVWKLRTARAA